MRPNSDSGDPNCFMLRLYLNETKLGQCWSELFHAQTLPEWDQTRTVVIWTVSRSDFTWMRPNSDSGDPNCFTLRLHLNETKLGQQWSELFHAQTLPEWDQTQTAVIRTVSWKLHAHRSFLQKVKNCFRRKLKTGWSSHCTSRFLNSQTV